MGLLTNTNIVVDQFYFKKGKESFRYIYFLTHMHSDHYWGLSNNWDLGPIYVSKLTYLLLMRRFPRLKNVTALDINKKYKLYLDEEKQLEVEVTMFDANHIFGSVIILFEGYVSK